MASNKPPNFTVCDTPGHFMAISVATRKPYEFKKKFCFCPASGNDPRIAQMRWTTAGFGLTSKPFS
jgi:hypothetical protein